VTASQPGNANYLAAANVPRTFTIATASQVITFNPLPNKTTSDPPFVVTAIASSGLAVSFTATGQCTISGSTVTIVGAGACTITASQAGNINFSPAPAVPQTFNITTGSSGASAAFVAVDTTTKGSWQSTYGFDGYNVIGDAVSYPPYAQVAPSGQASYTWAASTADLRGLQKATNPTDRIAATWYNTSFAIDVNLTDTNVHQVALYLVDWDFGGRTETLEVHDAVTNALLDTRTVSGFQNGEYVVWNISGHVTIRVTLASGPNAVVSGVFFGGNPPSAPPPQGTAAFVGVDTTTQGSWQGTYGFDGYNVIGDGISYPAYVQVTPAGQSSYTWAASTSDVRALQKPTNPTDRIAATWYSDSFSVDVNLTDSNVHQLALYLIDWDSGGRSETVEVHDAVTNALLDTRTVSGFQNGQYVVWNISGHVTVRVILTGGVNAVVSGLFFR
jgi:hypothetical protein